MKRLVLMGASLAIFGGAAYLGSTGAFFSDTETSTGNVFTAGAIDLKVDNTQHYNNAICTNTGTVEAPVYTWQLAPQQVTALDQYPVIGSACDGTWTLTDLGPANHFFNFGDVKPADQGEDTISLHIDNNPAWACMDIGTNANNENGINEPEAEAGDLTANGPADGELAQNIHVFGWLDNGAGGGVAGDNVWQAGEPQLFASTPLSGFNATTTLTLADSGTGTPLPGGSTSYVGLYWCAGTINSSGPGNLSCDGSTMGNNAQTDSATSTVQFRVEQSRNNSTFTCGGGEVVIPETATVTLDKIVTFTNAAIAGVDVSDYTLHLNGPGGDHVLVDQIPTSGLTPGVYTVSEVYSGNPANVTSTAVFGGSCTEIGITDTATMTVVAGVNPTCTITNSVSLNQ